MSTATAGNVGTEIGGLDFLWLEITGKCNLTCIHCYADSGPLRDLHGNMSDDDWANVLDEAGALGCRQVQFIGGEPTLHPGLTDFIDSAEQAGFELIEVFTNATRLNPTLIGCFGRHKVRVATSFYSDDPEVHDRITNGRGSWHRTVDGIRRVLDARLSLRVGIIEMEENKGQGERTAHFLRNLGVSDIGSDRQRGVGRAGLVGLAQPLDQLDELCGRCWNGKLCVTATGASYPCVFSRATLIGNAKHGLEAILSRRHAALVQGVSPRARAPSD